MIALAALRDPAPLHLVWGALGGGVLLAVVVSLLARGHDDEFERGRHLAAATSFGWAAVPAAVAVFFAGRRGRGCTWRSSSRFSRARSSSRRARWDPPAGSCVGRCARRRRFSLRAHGVFALAAGCAALFAVAARAEFPLLGGALRDRRRRGDAPAARVQRRTARHLGRCSSAARARRCRPTARSSGSTPPSRRRRGAPSDPSHGSRDGPGGLLELRRPRQQRAPVDLSERRLARLPVRSARHLAPSRRHRSVSLRGAAHAPSPIPAGGSASRSDPTSRPSSVPVR